MFNIRNSNSASAMIWLWTFYILYSINSFHIVQEVEYVKQEAKVVYLLECLQKTQPPVLIFAEKKQDVDAIHEYLLLKGVEAVAIHGGKGTTNQN